MIAPNNPINAYSSNNTLVITDYADNMARIAGVIAEIDTPDSLSADVIPIRYGIAGDIAPVVGGMMDTRGANDPTPAGHRGGRSAQQQRAGARSTRRARSWRANSSSAWTIRRPRPATCMWSICATAQAVKLAGVLRGALTGQSDNRGGAAPAAMAGRPAARRAATTAANPFRGGTSTLNTSQSAQTQSAMGGSATGANASQRFGQGGNSADRDGQGSAFFRQRRDRATADPTTNTLIISAPEPAVPQPARGHRPAGPAARAGAGRKPDRGVTERGRRAVRHPVDVGGNGFNGNGTTRHRRHEPERQRPAPSNSTATSLDAMGAGLSLGVVKGTVEVRWATEVINLGVLARAHAERTGDSQHPVHAQPADAGQRGRPASSWARPCLSSRASTSTQRRRRLGNPVPDDRARGRGPDS